MVVLFFRVELNMFVILSFFVQKRFWMCSGTGSLVKQESSRLSLNARKGHLNYFVDAHSHLGLSAFSLVNSSLQCRS